MADYDYINVTKLSINNTTDHKIIKDVVVEIDFDEKIRDRVVVKTTLSNPIFPFTGTLNFTIECPIKMGCQYVLDNMGFYPRVYQYYSSDTNLQCYRNIKYQ